jgi:hypothetical protein
LGGNLFHDILQCRIYFEEEGYPLLNSEKTKKGKMEGISYFMNPSHTKAHLVYQQN